VRPKSEEGMDEEEKSARTHLHGEHVELLGGDGGLGLQLLDALVENQRLLLAALAARARDLALEQLHLRRGEERG
jgi:hypothetical protein